LRLGASSWELLSARYLKSTAGVGALLRAIVLAVLAVHTRSFKQPSAAWQKAMVGSSTAHVARRLCKILILHQIHHVAPARWKFFHRRVPAGIAMVCNLLYIAYWYFTIDFCPDCLGRFYSGLGGRAVRRDRIFGLAVSSVCMPGASNAESELQESGANPSQLEPLAIWPWHAAYRRRRHYQLDRSLAAIRMSSVDCRWAGAR
jgi:hypothetical protein